MNLIQLKMPPDKARRLADILKEYIDANELAPDYRDLYATWSWLNNRVIQWHARHPDTPAA